MLLRTIKGRELKLSCYKVVIIFIFCLPLGVNANSTDRSGLSDRIFDASKPLSLDNRVYDFLLIRYFPERLTDNLLRGMFYSRLNYEKSEINPLGGRFFNGNLDARSDSDTTEELQRFRLWIKQVASRLPDHFLIRVDSNLISPVETLSSRSISSCALASFDEVSEFNLNPDYYIENERFARNECLTENSKRDSVYRKCEELSGAIRTLKEKINNGGGYRCFGEENKVEPFCSFSNVSSEDTLIRDVQYCLKIRCADKQSQGDSEYMECADRVKEFSRKEVKRLRSQNEKCTNKNIQYVIYQNEYERRACSEVIKQHVYLDCESIVQVAPVTNRALKSILFQNQNECGGHVAFVRDTLGVEGANWSGVTGHLQIKVIFTHEDKSSLFQLSGGKNRSITVRLEKHKSEIQDLKVMSFNATAI